MDNPHPQEITRSKLMKLRGCFESTEVLQERKMAPVREAVVEAKRLRKAKKEKTPEKELTIFNGVDEGTDYLTEVKKRTNGRRTTKEVEQPESSGG